MTISRRFVAPAVALAAAMLTACGTTSTPSGTPPPSAVPPAATTDVAGRDAYNAAICPVFESIIAIDPRLAALRAAGAEGEVSDLGGEIDALNDDLGGVLEALDAVPEWDPGADFWFQLITAVHGIRPRLLQIAGDPNAPEASGDLAALPFIASEGMDLAFRNATAAGHECAGEP